MTSEPSVIAAETAEAPSTAAWLLSLVPRILASRINIVLLLALGIYLVALPLTGLYTPNAQQMLVGGNFTNVTSDLGACIAAGGTITVLRRQHRRHRAAEAHEARIEASQQAIHDHLGTGHTVKETTHG